MARITGVTAHHMGLLGRLIYRFTGQRLAQFAGIKPRRMMEPLEIYAHAPGLLFGYAMFEWTTAMQNRVDIRLRNLAELKAATLTNCEYCIDMGSQIARRSGLSDEQLLALPQYKESGLFSDLEKLVLDYAVGISRTPVDVPDELFAELKKHFDDDQLVELTNVIALENMRGRFNLALGIGSAGFSEGMVCAVPVN